jgi:biotin carboxyl carrier protein
MFYDITINGKNFRLEIDRADSGWSCRLDGKKVEIDAILAGPNVLSLRIGNSAHEIRTEHIGDNLHLWVGNKRFAVEVHDPRSLRGRARAIDDHGPKKILAPMPGKVVRLLALEGDEIEAGQGILVVEAMKMQNEIKSPKNGRLTKVLVTEGAAVNPGDVLAIVE